MVQISASSGEILLYGNIGESIYSVDFSQKIMELQKVNKLIHLRINCGGEDLLECIKIITMIKSCNIPVWGFIDGVASDCGFIVAMFCDKLKMGKDSLLVTREVKYKGNGGAKELYAIADFMDELQNTLKSLISKKTGKPIDEISKLFFDKESARFTASEALELKIIDEIIVKNNTNQDNIKNNHLKMHTTKIPTSSFQSENALNPDEVKSLIQAALSENIISESIAIELEKQYLNQPPSQIKAVLKNFEDDRIKYLMRSSWDSLDKMNLIEELKVKYEYGYELKFFEKFGKYPNSMQKGKVAMDEEDELNNLIKFALKNSDLTDSELAFIKECRKNDTSLSQIKEHLKQYAQKRINTLMETSYDELDRKGLLEELKEKYLVGFKQKFKQKFGVDFSK